MAVASAGDEHLTNTANGDINQTSKLTLAQKNFLDFCRRVGWGVIEVKVKDGQPVMGSIIRQEEKFD